MQIPFVDLKAQYASIKDEIDAAIAGVIASTNFIGGEALATFEQAFAAYQGTKHAVGVASGTSAIYLVLQALGIQPGDEIITTPHTFIATIEPIEQIGAVPVFVDIDPVTYNIDPDQIEAAITERSRAIMPVHLYGQMAAMDTICEIAARHDLFVVEDAAQAHGATCYERTAGQWGHAAIFSYYPGKNLGAYGDAGAVCTNDHALAERVEKLRNHGRQSKYTHDILGFGERCDPLQAAILSAKLPHLDEWNNARRQLAECYTERLRDVPGLTVPMTKDGHEHVFHIYCIRVAGERDPILTALRERGISAGIHYPLPLHLQPAMAHRNGKAGDFPHTEAIADSIISLPLYPEMSGDQLNYVCEHLIDIMDQHDLS